MTPKETARELIKFAKLRGVSLKRTTVGPGFAVMLQFFEGVRPTGRFLSDALVYEWGVFKGDPGFQLNLTRMFDEEIYGKELDEDGEEVLKAVTQSYLQLKFFFPISPQLQSFGNKNRGCDSLNEHHDFAKFSQFILRSKPYRALKDSKPDRIEVFWWK